MPVKRITGSGGAIGSNNQDLIVHSIVLESGSDAATANLADQDGSGGTSIAPLRAASANTIDRAIYGHPGIPITDGGYVTLTGTGPVAFVHYSLVKGH